MPGLDSLVAMLMRAFRGGDRAGISGGGRDAGGIAPDGGGGDIGGGASGVVRSMNSTPRLIYARAPSEPTAPESNVPYDSGTGFNLMGTQGFSYDALDVPGYQSYQQAHSDSPISPLEYVQRYQSPTTPLF
jgi:hypothetical protein